MRWGIILRAKSGCLTGWTAKVKVGQWSNGVTECVSPCITFSTLTLGTSRFPPITGRKAQCQDSQAPPRRLLVKTRGTRRIAQRATVQSALRGAGERLKKHPQLFHRECSFLAVAYHHWVEHPIGKDSEVVLSQIGEHQKWDDKDWRVHSTGGSLGAVLGLHKFTFCLHSA